MLFDKVEVFSGEGKSPIILQNRFVRSATYEGIGAPDGSMTPALAAEMEKLAVHHVGLIIFSYFFTEECGRAAKFQLSMASDAAAESCRPIVNRVHELGSRCVAQICHAGIPGIVEKMGPSKDEEKGVREMSMDDIRRTITEFGKAALRAKNTGFDIVMIHSAHGYLLSQFLNPLTNHRTDEYGGSLENRARIVREVAREIRKMVGPDYPIAIKMNIHDDAEGGMTIEESTKVALWLAEDSVQLFEASCMQAIKKSTAGTCYNREGAASWKKALREKYPHALVALVGGVRSQKESEECVKNGVCDLISIARPFIREPDLVDIWAANPDHNAKAKCVSCGFCLRNAFAGKFMCVFNDPNKK